MQEEIELIGAFYPKSMKSMLTYGGGMFISHTLNMTNKNMRVMILLLAQF
jgi:hypothetical protein